MALKSFASVGGPAWNDPRFQRAILAQQLKSPAAAIPQAMRGQVSRDFAEQDMMTRLAFARTGLDRQGYNVRDRARLATLSEKKKQRQSDWDTFKYQRMFAIPQLALELGTKWYEGNEWANAKAQADANKASERTHALQTMQIKDHIRKKMSLGGTRVPIKGGQHPGLPYGLYGILS